ncbi:LysR substrate-binding domain-containing protein [Chitinasiproducens palmae]|uniref:DNA-binding transcriptional regulator, LysR family n=1 Tax=Chitinasiproducens palmae TaxID=1770053 RepID=A0A1H2PLD1_9BURK|nr:LysR substrate-binding domain-containing protein [Chitinasiproducens palmae]SDV46470.1 DNA-binding transcriptional regulator, LysR family [Chitinasiproducens palmae]
MRKTNLDLDALRSFVAGVELGSFARAADRLGRSTSALSAQLRKLETQVDQTLFIKAGRGLALTDAGERLLDYARRMLELNDEVSMALRGDGLAGEVRIGLQADFGEHALPAVLARFGRAHPGVALRVNIARSSDLQAQVDDGRLDLALLWSVGEAAAGERRLADVPLHWIGNAMRIPVSDAAPLPVALMDAPCPLRTIAISALDGAGRPWRQVLGSASVAALWAAAAAGLALTVRTRIGLPASLRVLDADEAGLPPLPTLGLSLRGSSFETARSPACRRLAAMLIDAATEMAIRANGVLTDAASSPALSFDQDGRDEHEGATTRADESVLPA